MKWCQNGFYSISLESFGKILYVSQKCPIFFSKWANYSPILRKKNGKILGNIQNFLVISPSVSLEREYPWKGNVFRHIFCSELQFECKIFHCKVWRGLLEIVDFCFGQHCENYRDKKGNHRCRWMILYALQNSIIFDKLTISWSYRGYNKGWNNSFPTVFNGIGQTLNWT